MIQQLLFVYWSFSICTFLTCSVGTNGDNVSTLNNILKADNWEKLVTIGLNREFKSIDGKVMNVKDLLKKEVDGNIVTPTNYTDKLVISSTAINCLYSESLKFINEMFIEIIAGHCMSFESTESMLVCMEKFWETMDIKKSLIEKMLVALNFFYEASKDTSTTIVIDTLKSLLPHYISQKYTKPNYLDDNDSFKMDNFNTDYKFLLDMMNMANEGLGTFLKTRCWSNQMSENKKLDDIVFIEKSLVGLKPDEVTNEIFTIYNKNLFAGERSFITRLGLDEGNLRV